jgi:hypothetical protein
MLVQVTATLRFFEINEEYIELGQHGEASDHRLGCKVPGIGNFVKMKIN